MKKIITAILASALLFGCGTKKEEVKKVDLKEVYTVATEGIELPMFMELDDAALQSYEIDPSLAESYLVQFPMMNVQASSFWMFEAKEGKLEELKEQVTACMAIYEANWATYLPEQHALVMNRKTIEKGNYYIVVIAEEAETIAANIENAMK